MEHRIQDEAVGWNQENRCDYLYKMLKIIYTVVCLCYSWNYVE